MIRVLASLSLLGLTACGGSDYNINENPNYGAPGDQRFTGRVCDPITHAWLPGVTVYTHLYNANGFLTDTETTTSDADGVWELQRLRAGNSYTIFAQYGSELIDMFDIEFVGGDQSIETPSCADNGEIRAMVVEADYDHFDEVLPQLGINEFDTINGLSGYDLGQFLSNSNNMGAYDVVFFPGGHLEEDIFYDLDASGDQAQVDAVLESIRRYVQQGGWIYVSDWSVDVIERIWPDRMELLGDDMVPDSSQIGSEAIVMADITDSDLAASVGAESVEIKLDIDQWPVVEAAGVGAEVHLRANVPYRIGPDTFELYDVPLLLSFEEGAGRVVFSPWRQSSNLTGDARLVVQHFMDQI